MPDVQKAYMIFLYRQGYLAEKKWLRIGGDTGKSVSTWALSVAFLMSYVTDSLLAFVIL